MTASASLRATLLLAVTSYVWAMDMTGRPGHGLVGYGIPMFDPLCPSACRGVLSESQLNCSTTMKMDGMSMVDTSTSCYATDTDFLASMAWCIKPRCTDLEAWKIEEWWQRNMPGKQVHQADPKWTYQETLHRVPTAPRIEVASGDPLNTTASISDEVYETQANAMTVFGEIEINHSKYGLVLLISAVVIPIAASMVRYLPLPSLLTSKFYAIFIDRSIVPSGRGGIYRKLFPDLTRGQAIFVFYLLAINLILCSVGYRAAHPNPWYPSLNREILTYVANRTGVLSFANIPVLVLYAGRNNILLCWLTNWDHTTFIVLHSWVAGICAMEAIVHSILYVVIYVQKGAHNTESQLPYWYWGIIATLGFSILLPGSIKAIRKKAYEVFLASHIALALLSLVGCYYHIYFKFAHQWGYELWLYIAFGLWAFDRLLRVLRVVRNGFVRSATITVIDDEHVRLDVEGLTGDGPAYLYFPTLSWRVWENHPFSIATTYYFPPTGAAHYPPPEKKKKNNSSPDSDKSDSDVEITSKTPHIKSSEETRPDDEAGNPHHPATAATGLPYPPSKPTLRFLIRTQTGTTALLRHHRQMSVLVESGYPSSSSSVLHPASHLICLAGGVGITAVLPALETHRGRRNLYWSCRSRALVEVVEGMIGDGGGFEKDVLVGGRYDIRKVVEAEMARGDDDVVVLVSGPREMLEDAREVVCDLATREASRGRGRGRSVRLVSEAFDW